MFQDDVKAELRVIPRERRGFALRTCKVSEPVERPWGRPYRVVEWLLQDRRCRRIVAADSSVTEVVEAVLSHVPGRCILPADDEVDGEPRQCVMTTVRAAKVQ